MCGNVREWCENSFYESVAGCCALATPPAKGEIFEQFFRSERCVRGASFRSRARGCRCAHRERLKESWSQDDVGFRPVLRAIVR